MSESNNSNNPNHHYESSLNKWIKEEKYANEFINVLTKLFYDKSIELIFFRTQLFDRSASIILHRHSYSERLINKQLNIKTSLDLANVICSINIPPTKIDIGKLNMEFADADNKIKDPKEFINLKLGELIGKSPNYDKPVDVVLYGFGRIGRLLARELIIQGNGSQLRVRAIVARKNSGEDLKKRASLFRHDSIHGPFRGVAVEDVDKKTIFVNGHYIKMLEANNPEDIDYESEGIFNALLIDNTGILRTRNELERHLKAKGITRVLLTAPAKGDVPNIVYGVNQLEFDVDKNNIYSAASCTTNAAVPVISVIEKELGIEKGHLETIHSYTNDQNLLDNFHKKHRRGRSAPVNMVITETGAASATVKVIPSLKGKLTGNAVRVPTPNVSLVILTLTIKKEATVESLNNLIKKAAFEGDLVEQIRYSNAYDAVSSDFIGDSAACIFDSPATKVSEDKKNIVVYLWYDNEFGYSIQVIRVAKYISKVLRYKYY